LDDQDLHLSEPHSEGVYEHLWVVDGVVIAGPADDTVELRIGDYFCFPGWQPHSYRSTTAHTRFLIVLSYTRRPLADRQPLAHF
jgi:mannose-6-phosphate isomerase-like protein (cupin superfamily)